MNTWLESVLLQADNWTGSKGSPDACLELVNLYRDTRPLSALAFGRKARRLGCDMELGPLEAAVAQMSRARWSADPVGCFRLGTELGSHPLNTSDVHKAIAYLKIAAESGDSSYAGSAALNLADLLSSLSDLEAYRYYSIAEDKGFYDILPPARQRKKTAIA